jgi:hypothetical protein
MPMYESSGIRRSNLTKQQRLEAEAALYGYPMTTDEKEKPITREEIERLREIVNQHDREAGIKEFDLNKPPVEPYTYKPFPKLLYNHKERTTKVAASQEEMDKLAKDGFVKEPFPPEQPKKEYDALIGADYLEQKGSVLDRDAKAQQGHADKPKTK